MVDYVVNNFTAGEVSPKMGGRFDLGIYHNGVKKLENFLPMLQGGFTRRPGSHKIGELPYAARLIPFIISVHQAYLIELSHEKMRIWENDALWLDEHEAPIEVVAPWTEAMLPDIQYTQDYQSLYLVHRDMPPQVVLLVGVSMTLGERTFTYDDTISELGDYRNLFASQGDYPGCVAYCTNRLWYASTTNHPYRLFASRPFETDNFKTFDISEVVEEVFMDPPWPEGWEEDPESIMTEKIIEREIRPATCAMVLEVGSNRSDRIHWLCSGSNIIIGTASNEWTMPGNINALQLDIFRSSSYGSYPIQGLTVNEDIMFIQSGGKRCRSYVFGGEGYSSPDMNYTADHILSSGVKEMHHQRIPESRIYFVLNNGDVAVLSYNKMYELQAWSLWTFGGDVESMAVVDTPGGQDVYYVLNDGTNRLLGKFDEDEYADMIDGAASAEYISRMITNRLDMSTETGTTVGKKKRVSSVVFRLIDTEGFRIGYNRLETHTSVITEGDHKELISGGYENELAVTVESVNDKPLTVLAMVMGMEVG